MLDSDCVTNLRMSLRLYFSFHGGCSRFCNGRAALQNGVFTTKVGFAVMFCNPICNAPALFLFLPYFHLLNPFLQILITVLQMNIKKNKGGW